MRVALALLCACSLLILGAYLIDMLDGVSVFNLHLLVPWRLFLSGWSILTLLLVTLLLKNNSGYSKHK